MLWPKKNSYKEFANEKKFLRLENSPPPPPHNFSNGPSLMTETIIELDYSQGVSNAPGRLPVKKLRRL